MTTVQTIDPALSIHTPPGSGPAHHPHHAHPAHLAHHFDTLEQQAMSGKLGMWVFLATEILMFGGLFCAYSVYRHNHPEVFAQAHKALNKMLGAINTVVLITSSLTMAWGVRCAQLNQRKGLILCLVLTLFGGLGFMVIKTIEYKAKWDHGYWFGQRNQYDPRYQAPAGAPGEHLARHTEAAPGKPGEKSDAAQASMEKAVAKAGEKGPEPAISQSPVPLMDPNATNQSGDGAKILPKSTGPAGLIPAILVPVAQAELHAPEGHHEIDAESLSRHDRDTLATFFNIYFCMTGLHGLHVLIGMGLITWILIRSIRGEFSTAYFNPVDLVGLYWHLVDLIWIFLFPLLYLIV